MGLGCSRMEDRPAVRGLLLGQRAGRGLDGNVHVLPAAKVAGRRLPVLQVCDAVLHTDTA